MDSRARTALFALGLTLLFVVVSFPYGPYGAWLASRAGQAVGARVHAAQVTPALSWGGPVLRASQLSVVLADGTRLDAEELRVRPALSLTWLGLDPALRVWLESRDGRVDGTLWLGDAPAFSGELLDLDLGALAERGAADPLGLTGRADLQIDLATLPEGLVGEVTLDARSGSFTLPPYGVPVPFESLRGRFSIDPASGVEVASLELEDPSLSLQATGRLGTRPSLERGPIDLEGELSVRNPGLRAVLANAVRLDREGRARLRVQGTLSSPILR